MKPFTLFVAIACVVGAGVSAAMYEYRRRNADDGLSGKAAPKGAGYTVHESAT